MFIISLLKSILTFANFIAFLLNNSDNSVSITSVIIFIYSKPIFAGIVTDFNELNNFPSTNLNTVSLFLSVTFPLSSSVNASM